ncbi:MAG: hypothetical protein V3S22_01845 [Candidatus Neomarinimicrobiota bacterium]
MNKLKRQFFWLTVWGISFGMIEAAVVYYLRQIYYPGDFQFPAALRDDPIMKVELAREAVTIIMLWAAAELSRKTIAGKIAVFMFLFGVWDIFYYVFLKIMIGWPEALTTWDILFLLPLVWAGPVWAPLLVSMVLIACAIILLNLDEKEIILKLSLPYWAGEMAAAVLIVLSFILPGLKVAAGQIPDSYPWYIFLLGLILGIIIFMHFIKKSDR